MKQVTIYNEQLTMNNEELGMRNDKRKIILCLLIIAHCSFLTANLFAEQEFSLRLAPSLEIPLNIPEIRTGMGATVGLDWAFWQFASDFNLGATAVGSFSSLPFETGEAFTLFGGGAGLFLRYRPFDRWAFRFSANAGVYQYNRGDGKGTYPYFSPTLGAEFFLSPYFSLYADASYAYRLFTSIPLQTFGASFGIKLNITEIMGDRSRVRMEKTKQNNVFPVSYAWYENNPIATVAVTNEEPNTINDVEVSFFMDSFMSQPTTFIVIPSLAQGETIDVDVTVLFNEAMMLLNEPVNASGLLLTQYRSLGAKKQSETTIEMPIFKRNTLSWDDDRRAAAFVSPDDYATRSFARLAETAIRGYQSETMPKNVIYAAGIFEALRLYGISYIIDPNSSYTALSDDASALDNLNYPYETLRYKGGDCDDLSILFCSLLEAVGVETAFITVPGHIYAAIAVGDDNWQANSAEIIQINGKRWLPIEITVPAEGFVRAWRIGAREWNTTMNNEKLAMSNGQEVEGAALFPIREAWEIYPSVTVPASGINIRGMPQRDAILKALTDELRTLR